MAEKLNNNVKNIIFCSTEKAEKKIPADLLNCNFQKQKKCKNKDFKYLP